MKFDMKKLAVDVANLKGQTLQMDFSTINGGHKVTGYIPQADINIGVTVRGVSPYFPETDESPEVEIYCINKSRYWDGRGKGWSEQDYYYDLISLIRDVEAGIHVVPPPDSSLVCMVPCAF